MVVPFDNVRLCVLDALADVYREEGDLLALGDQPRIPKIERTIAGYLFLRLRERLLPRVIADGKPDARVDLEYRRAGWQAKALMADVYDGDDYVGAWNRRRPIVPDIVVHERGHGGANVLAVEVKHVRVGDRLTTREIESDWAKLALLTGNVPYAYLVEGRSPNPLRFQPPAHQHVRLTLPNDVLHYEVGVWVGMEPTHVELRWWRRGGQHGRDGEAERIPLLR